MITAQLLCIRASPLLHGPSAAFVGEVPTRATLHPVHAHASSSSLSSQVQDLEYVCNSCKAKGWLICDFCNGQKTNVQVKNNKMYRRCPSCKAAGVILCHECKVYRCVTFPDGNDSGFEM